MIALLVVLTACTENTVTPCPSGGATGVGGSSDGGSPSTGGHGGLPDEGGHGGTGGQGGVIVEPECSLPTDCPGLENECAARTCEAGACGQAFEDYGVEAEPWMIGDCYLDICNGAGNVIAIYDETDILDDGDECTVDYCTHFGTVHEPIEGCMM